MRKLILITFLLMTLVLADSASADDFAYRVAAKCTGEASFAIEGCAWTVVNRLDAGWSKSKVLNAYYARSIPPTQESIDLVRPILDGTTDKENPDFYYMLSFQDVHNLGIEHIEPLEIIVKDPNRYEIWFYDINLWR